MSEAAISTEDSFDVELPEAPYPGLRPFERNEWPVFFGRETMTAEAIRRLLEQNFLVVHGDSGCGKSSLIRAGVLVQLEQRHARGDQRWRTCSMLPRAAPLRNLARELAGLKAAEPSSELVRDVRRALNAGRGAAARLETLLCPNATERICILVDQFEEIFRYAKETNAAEARLFVDVLAGLLETADARREAGEKLRLYAILTMRSEFLGACARFSGLAEAVNRTQYLLPPMDRPALLRAIRDPAPLYGGEVDRALAERLIADAGGDQDQLPLIQHGLMRLWRREGGDAAPPPADPAPGLEEASAELQYGETESIQAVFPEAAPSFSFDSGPAWRLELEDYHRGGGLAALLSAHAEEVMTKAVLDPASNAPDPSRKKTVERLFRALTDINAEGHAIRRPQTFGQLQAVTGADGTVLRNIVDHFRAEGVSFLMPHGEVPILDETPIDISHEALIRCWQRIADPDDGWLQREFRDGLVWKSLRLVAERGETLSPPATASRDDWLDQLKPTPAWTQRYDGGWDQVQQLMARSRTAREVEERRQRDYLEAQEQIARQQRERAEAEERRRADAEAGSRRYRRVAIIAGAFFCVAVATAGLASWFAFQAGQSAKVADQSAVDAEEQRATAVKALQVAEEERARAAASAQVAEIQRQFAEAQRNQALRNESLFRSEQARKMLRDGLPVTAMQLALEGLPADPDAPGARPWVGETAGALAEALSEQRKPMLLRGHEGIVAAARYSPDGTRIVSGSDDGTARVWDASSGAELLVLRGHEGPINTAEYSPDGRRIVSGSDDRTARVWDASSGAELLVLRGHENWVIAASYSPDGARIVSGSWDTTIRVWDAASGAELLVLRGHDADVNAVGYSPDGTRIVTGSYDGTVRLWDGSTGAELLVLSDHEGSVNAVGYSTDGERIVSGSSDGTIRVWDAESGAEELVLRGHEGRVYAAGFSPDGGRIVSGSGDGTVRVWDAESGAEELVLRGHEDGVNAAGFSPDGGRIVSGSQDGTVRVWDAASGAELLVLRNQGGSVYAAGNSADGARIVGGADDGTVWVTWIGRSKRELIEVARAELPRELTEAERRRYYLTAD